MVPHAIGCLCCTGRSALVDALRRMYARRSRDEAPAFDHVVIETAAGADPAPVMQTLLNNALVTQYYRLCSVVCLLDAGLPQDAVGAATHALKQLAVCDRVVLTGIDRAAGMHVARLEERLRALNPAADICRMGPGESISGALTPAGYHAVLQRGEPIEAWLRANRFGPESSQLEGDLHAFAVSIDEPVEWEAFHQWLDAGVRLNGDVLYRTKGVVNVYGNPAPVLIHGVQQVLQPPVQLPGWTSTDQRTRLVFVTRELERDAVASSLQRDLPVFVQRSHEREQRRQRSASDPSLPV